MARKLPSFRLDEEMYFAGKPMRVAGLLRLEGASGQQTIRYLFAEPSGSPVIVEEGDGLFSALRPLPAAAILPAAGNTVTIGGEKYTLVAVRKLKVLKSEGQAPGGTPPPALLLSGVFEGPSGTLMREMVPGSRRQAYYLMKALRAGEILSGAQHAAAREAEGRSAAQGAMDKD